jgi:asparagine synthase (glutamine-hydrolysing)
MCGIAGILSFDPERFSVNRSLLVEMRDTMIHRGPDSAGVWASNDGRAGLAHRRLSIIDLSDAAAQPMCNEDGTLWITYNGEIYNHAAIRSELESLGGYRWKTDHSDTEVILHAFEQWGIDCLRRFRGMFAFALWDAKKRELWLVRDRIGVKPLYYSIHHERITFASEIKALLVDPEQARAVNEEALFYYLSFLTTPAPLTLFEGIRKLASGTFLRVSADGQVFESRYWDAWDHTEPLAGRPESEIAERILEELRASVSLRKVSDVPVGVFLSGGIDSSVNAALFSEGNHGSVRTFSVGYGEEAASCPSELKYARQMADFIHAEHHERTLSEDDLLGFLPRMVHLQDEPIADPVCFPIYFLSRLAREDGVIVCQVGEGADELFWGYPRWKLKRQIQRCADFPIPQGLRQIGPLALRALGMGDTVEYELLRRDAQGLPIFWSGAEAFTESQIRGLLSPRLRTKLGSLSAWDALRPIRRNFEQKAWEKSHLHWMTYADLNFRLPELLLMRVDKMSMGTSLECRVPFLDHKFVELALSIPESVKVRNGVLKYILKKAVRGVIPGEIINRRKQGFGAPVGDWFSGRLGSLARRELSEFCEQTDLLDPRTVQSWLDKNDGQRVWFLLNLALWFKHFMQPAGSAQVETACAALN